MKVIFQCPTCGEQIEKDAALAPSYVECPKCEGQVIAPTVAIGLGTILGGFRVEKSIGRGSMGDVYLATQLVMDRKVALKILPPAIDGNEARIQRFLHEIHMLAKVEHPNIVTAFDAGKDKGVYYLAMSYVEGEDLAGRLKREGVIPEKEALRIVLQVARALSYAWDKHNILHNDIKPANIMIDKGGEVRIMDMGLSKNIFEQTGLSLTGVTWGTPNYMSPEQAQAKCELDCRSDMYGLGATLYHMVTGKLPHYGATLAEVLTSKLTQPCPSAREANENISRACEHVLHILLERDPEKRYPGWSDAIKDMEGALAGREPLTMFHGKGVSVSGSGSEEALTGGGREEQAEFIARSRRR